ncbi:MAG TPA: type IV pilus assembly protein PilM [Phycisphaerae bacterium]|jgi:type IV pilus assembly protein PilM|nr:type IV pilus assembly protein PilM [Phycisphaerae bacterium]HOJ56501.1 type IV pilus assembly protein PilM [Phycisphaerae bacterium]HOL25855.1 type IV pilus assembly protein PilM [Phycisphaerae bacterium]HPP21271.1 type IV pilus assembly protein PilM [Phycisphaerae bacterium]HPU31991.1 type IV pilus assembly protein PilM [Phycisphaerae bacterium]
MATNRPVWGIDLGQNALKAIRLRPAGDMVEAVEYAYIEHARILSSQQDPAARAGMIAETMKKFLDGHNLSKEQIVVAVPGQHTLAKFVKLPPADKKKVPDIVKYEAQQQIPFDMEEVIWDYQIFSHSAEGAEVGIFAMRREVLRDHLRFLSDLNLEPLAVQSAPLALYSALKFDGIIGDEATAVLDIGAQNSDLIICTGDSLWTRNIPIGGNHFTEALVKTFKLSFNKAENLKRTAASSKYARQIFQAMRPVFADLVAEVQRSIGFFTGSHRGVKLARVIAMGNAFQLPGMVKFIQQNLGMDVVRPNSFSRLSASEVPNAPDLLKQLGSFGVAYGLALQGLGKSQITSNLLPPDIAKQIVWRKKTPWFYGAAACLVLASGLVWSRTLMDASAIAAVREDPAATSPPSFPIEEKEFNGVKVPEPAEAALNILERGPSTTNELGYANAVVAASQHLSQVEQQLRSLNDNEARKVKDIADLETYKAVWPKLLHMIHSALPQDELTRAMAEGPEQYLAAIAKEPFRDRRKRRVITIDRMYAKYSDDVMSLFNASVGKGPAPGMAGQPGATDTSSGPPLPGFVITIEGRTPNEGAFAFVDSTLVARLNQMGPKKEAKPGGNDAGAAQDLDSKIYFDRVRLLNCQPASFGNVAGHVGITPPWGGGGMAAAAQVDDSKDPVTGESMKTDHVFEIKFVAVLSDKSISSAPPAAPADPDLGF